MDRLSAMQAFVAVVEAGSFVGAADELGVSKTSISRLVVDLESHLGARLLQRTTRRVRPTEAGERFFARASLLLSDLEEAESEVTWATIAPSGLLRVSVPLSFGQRYLAPLFPLYREQYPDVQLEVSLTDHVVDLVNEGFDLAIRGAWQHRETYVARHLAPVRVVICASPAYVAKHGVPQSPEALTGHNCLTKISSATSEIWTISQAGDTVSIPVRGSMRADSDDVLVTAALAGEGVVVMPTFMVGDDIAQGNLVPLLLDWQYRPLTLMAVYPTRRYLSAKVRTFVEFMQKAFAGEPAWDRWMDMFPEVRRAHDDR
ncbi:DNA-binding transcriptional regulator, LysR family [Variovorax sp. YR750]|uniref:LysR family transcriptional regulator n=1 Tax=unclassified Variovorax TaxID=663243 RepID=UPI0008C1823E|nr:MULTISPECIES: LysR family transcriptional regulator [unclassified Variovorax]SEM53493.1 DNA-binding transcriptional regulator, LysR family [Variovorax sp. YR750]SOD30677.1 transcriptional regulator, LysR family [Variovorax sp. YR752]